MTKNKTDNKKMYRAKLDADQIYWGVEAVDELADGDVAIDPDCDLAQGKYKWNADAHPTPCFEPLPKDQRRDTPQQPLADRALYELIVSLDKAGMKLPDYCEEWAMWYEKTLDMRGAK